MRRKRVLAGVLAATLAVGNLTLPESISLGGFDFGTVSAQAAGTATSGTCGENLTWELDADGVLTISGTGEMEDYSSLAAVPWSSYTYNYGGLSIVSVIIEDGVTTIGDRAFYGCFELTSVTIPDGVTSIGNLAFESCSKLTSVELPDSVTTIGDEAFENCSTLSNINITDNVTSIGNCAFLNCDCLADEDGFVIIEDVLYGYCGEETEITVPDGVATICDSACYQNKNITKVVLSESVTYIGDYAFESSTLTSIDLTDSVTYIGECAFWASALESIVIPESITEIQYGTFYFCDKLTSIELPDTLTSIGELAFAYSGLISMEMPDSVTEVGSMAFAWSSLTCVMLSENLTSVGTSAFNGCKSLATVYIPVTITYDEDENPFGYCEALTDVYYSGSKEEWYENSWNLDEYLAAATIHFDSALIIYELGDVNGDKNIDYLDAMTVLRYDAELMELTDEQLSAADVNGDGSVNSLDAILMLRYDAGLIESF